MPATSKWALMLNKVAGYYIQWKRAQFLNMAFQSLDNLPPSSDTQVNSDTSELSISPSSLSSVSSPSSSTSDYSRSSSLGSHSDHSSNGSKNFKSLEDMLLAQWDAQIQTLALYLLTAQVLNAGPPVQKVGQLDLYLIKFRHNHPDRFRKRLCISPAVFDHLVELIKNHDIFHNNSHIP